MKIIISMIVFILVANPLAFAENKLAENNNAFAIKLYHQLKDNKGNIFFSSYSISSALAICYAGARGNTQKEMASVLHFPLEQEQLHKDFYDLKLGLEKMQKKGYVELNVANSLWAQKDYEFLPKYLSSPKNTIMPR